MLYVLSYISISLNCTIFHHLFNVFLFFWFNAQKVASALSKLNFGVAAQHPMSSCKEETGAVL
jgi:hypothetical protein